MSSEELSRDARSLGARPPGMDSPSLPPGLSSARQPEAHVFSLQSRIMLAQGSSQAFDCFHIVAGGEVSSLPTATTVAVPSRTAVRQAMLEDRVMLIDESTPRRQARWCWSSRKSLS
jgi:hypothetical protein